MPLTNYTLKLNQNGNSFTTKSPISLRNVVREGQQATVETIEAIGNVTIVSKTDGAFLQYNSTTDKYEVVQAALDGGLF
jgi:uncharacterized surface protein with fasciclin (FAS1) repeats|tara:strand:- start:1722 stop:1958 length:237 start_codon:yes stop_codon:yes gene_type:complete